VSVAIYSSGQARMQLPSGPVRISQATDFPASGRVELVLYPAVSGQNFPLRLRIPGWALPASVRVNGSAARSATSAGWLQLRRSWRRGDRVTVELPMRPRLVAGAGPTQGLVALLRGPSVLALDQRLNSPALSLASVALPTTPRVVERSVAQLSRRVAARGEQPVYSVRVVTPAGPREAIFTPFVAAGDDGGAYRVWLRSKPASAASMSILAGGREDASRAGNVSDSITDGDPSTFRVTFDGHAAAEDWFEVSLAAPAVVGRVRFAHGKTFHDGGWFDASAGKPRIEIRDRAGGPWREVARLETYPATTQHDSAGIRNGRRSRPHSRPRESLRCEWWARRPAAIRRCRRSARAASSRRSQSDGQ
jgi:hypothetical protein